MIAGRTRRRSAPAAGSGRRIRVGHLVPNYLAVSEHWIHTQMTAAPAVTPLVLNRGLRIEAHRAPVAAACHLDTLTPAECRAEASGWERRGLSAAFFRAARAFRCDLLHAHFGTEGALGFDLARALGVPIVTSFYGYDVGSLPRDAAWRPALARLFERGTLFLAEGPALARRLASLGCHVDRIRIVPIPVDVPARVRRRRESPPLVLVCARLVEKKGVDDALGVMALVNRSRRPFRAVIVGDGPERGRLDEQAGALGLRPAVTFAGMLPRERVATLLRRATVVLQMSRDAADGDCEGGAPVILSDALAAGTPVVATRHGDIPSVVREGLDGLLVESGDVRGAARHLARLIDDPRLAARLGREARSRARTFGRGLVGRRLRTCYDQALAFGPPAAGAREGARAPIIGDIVVELLARGGHAGGLKRRLDRLPVGDRHRPDVLRAIARVALARGRVRDAARATGRWSREQPSETHACLEEARLWIESGDVARAGRASVRFVERHHDPAGALAILSSTFAGAPAGPRLLREIGRRLRSEAARVAERAGRLQAAGAIEPGRAAPLEMLVGDLQLMSGSGTAAWDDWYRAEALAAVVDLARRIRRPDLAEAALRALPSAAIKSPIARYRVASRCEDGAAAERRWARLSFAALANDSRLPDDLRAGAFYHIGRIDLARRRATAASLAAHRCLDLMPGHRRARTLLQQAGLLAERVGP